MPTSTPQPLTASGLRLALIAGAQRVIDDRDRLNRINVFPVADGDTGSNLAHTLGSVLSELLGHAGRHAGELLGRVGETAIDGARGNSGAILAQFLHGAASAAGTHATLDVATLASALRQGATSAREALAVPVEGTILSVMDAFCVAFDAASRLEGATPRTAFVDALEPARRALADTPQQMPLLQKAGVVDAGAAGFVDLLEGIAALVTGGRRVLRERSRVPAFDARDAGHSASPAHGHADPDRRWCTECLLLGEALDRDALRASLEAIDADSLVLAGGARRLRVHAHVANPQAMFDACARLGSVEAMKADDMLLQARGVVSDQHIAIVTDSAADLPAALAERFAIHVVPLRVNLDGREYLDKIGLGTAEFYARMASSQALPKTSQPPPGDFRRTFDLLAAHHEEVLYVGLSRAISGTLQSAEQAASRPGGGQVRVFDTVNAGAGQGLLVWRAAELVEAGLGIDAVLTELVRLRPLTLTWAMARDIRHAVRGGRIPAWAGPVVRFSGLTPIAKMRDSGTLAVVGGLLARARAPEAFARYVARRTPPGQRWRAIVGHCDARADAERALAALRGRIDLAEAHVVETGAAIGAHAGRGTLVISLQPAPQGHDAPHP